LELVRRSRCLFKKGLMKKNAVLVASILFVAGSAVAKGDDYASKRPVSDPTVSSQYDPASHASGSALGSHNSQTSVGDYHADSSVRGGSNEARGVARNHLSFERRAAHPMNPALQADSSIRGGSVQARQRDWDDSMVAPSTSDPTDSRVKADSSIRGGSNEARYPNAALQSGSGRDDFGEGHSDSWPSDKDGSLSGSANWNPADDLMKDGILSSGNTALIQNNDASVNGAASISSTSPLDDFQVQESDLNSSPRIEKDIAGEYNLDDQTDTTSALSKDTLTSEVPSDSSFSTEAVGGPGSTQTGASSSSQGSDNATPVDTTPQGTVPEYNGTYLFENNRAQGVGSSATGESGLTRSERNDSLARRVKATLTQESTGTIGPTRSDVARNIQVSNHGSTVILKGTVSSQKDKDLIEIRAREISGVERVDNQLTVAPQSDSAVRDLRIGHDLEDKTDSLRDVDRQQE